jgi:MFS family permease
MIQSVFSLGSFAGLIVMNLISDTKGRRFSTLLSLGLSLVGVICILFTKIVAILGGIFKVIALLIFAQFLGGFGAYALVALSYTLLYDFCSDKYRPNAVVIVNTAWSVSTIGLGVSYLLEINWLNFLLYVVLIPLFIVSVSMYKFLV